MKKLLAAVLMLAVVIGLSACGSKKEETAAPAGPNAEAIVKAKCATCHGQNLEGTIGPKLADIGARLTKDDIAKIIKDGKTGTIGVMPPGSLTDQKEIDAVAAYLAAKK